MDDQDLVEVLLLAGRIPLAVEGGNRFLGNPLLPAMRSLLEALFGTTKVYAHGLKHGPGSAVAKSPFHLLTGLE